MACKLGYCGFHFRNQSIRDEVIRNVPSFKEDDGEISQTRMYLLL
jgi:hypothetical protein